MRGRRTRQGVLRYVWPGVSLGEISKSRGGASIRRGRESAGCNQNERMQHRLSNTIILVAYIQRSLRAPEMYGEEGILHPAVVVDVGGASQKMV